MSAIRSYWKEITTGTSSVLSGLKLTFRHLFEARDRRSPIGVDDPNYFEQKTGIVTLQYPHEELPVPDHGRYKLHNEIDDCIVCDKCAKICPVDCIDIEPIRSPEELGKTSDGTPKRIHAARFDIDMAKCCFCGLCTTVCPTECLTMTKEYDFSEFDINEHNFEFSEMTPLQILEAKQKLEEATKAREAQKVATAAAKPKTGKPQFKPKTKPASPTSGETTRGARHKPTFNPRVKPAAPSAISDADSDKPKPAYLPKVKPLTKPSGSDDPSVASKAEIDAAKSKPVFRPKVKPVNHSKSADDKPTSTGEEAETPKAKPVFRPKVKPIIKPNTKGESTADQVKADAQKSKPVLRPKVKPVIKKPKDGDS